MIRALLRRLAGPSAQISANVQAAVQEAGGGVIITTAQDLEAYIRRGDNTPSVPQQRAMTIAAYYACVRIIAGAVANSPVHIKRRVSDRERQNANDHFAFKLFNRRPNAWMTPVAFRRMMTAIKLTRGNAFALKVRGVGGRIIALLPLREDAMRLEPGRDMRPRYIYTWRDRTVQEFAAADIYHLMGMTMNGWSGMSVLEYARRTLGESLDAAEAGSKLFRNNMHVGGALTHPKALGTEGTNNLKKSLDEYRGEANAGKWLILEEGMTANPFAIKPVDAQWLESRKFSRQEIAMFFGVPPHMIGDTEKSTSWGSGIAEQGIGFKNYVLLDHLNDEAQTIDRDLIADPDGDLYAHINPDALLRGDIKARYEAYKIGRDGGWLSANDIRAKEDDNPIDGGDEYLTPLNMTASGADAPAPDNGATDESA